MSGSASSDDARYHDYFEGALDGMLVLDHDGHIHDVNAYALSMLGRERSDVLHRKLGELFEDASAAAIARITELAAKVTRETRGRFRDLRLQRPDRSLVAVEVSAARIEAVGGAETRLMLVMRESTEHVQAVDALARAQRDLRRMLDALPDAVAFVRDEMVIYANPAAAIALGYRIASELVGKTLIDLLPADEHRAVQEHAATLRDNNRTLPPSEGRLLRKDGSTIWTEVSASSLTDFEGGPAFFVFARDVTERRRMQEQLMVADRMAAIGTLAAGVAHEINNPLAAVIANIELARRTLVPADPNAEDIDEIKEELSDARDAAERVRHIVRDLKLFSRAEEEHMGPVDLQQALNSSIRLAWGEIRHRARLVTDYEPVALVRANESRLGQVFLNVLINAAHSIREGHAEENTISVSTKQKDVHFVRVEIADTGAGIAPEHMRRLFTPFFTTKPIGEGTGLGLSICHRIVTTLGGEISVSSELGKGTVVRIDLPGGSGIELDEPISRVLSMPPKRRGLILVIDDEASITTTMRRLFSEDHDVVTCDSAEPALARLMSGDRFDVILCDLMMPQMTGMDLYAELRAKLPEQADRVIFVTGGAFTPRAREFLDQVDNQRVEKPFDLSVLRALVNSRIN